MCQRGLPEAGSHHSRDLQFQRLFAEIEKMSEKVLFEASKYGEVRFFIVMCCARWSVGRSLTRGPWSWSTAAALTFRKRRPLSVRYVFMLAYYFWRAQDS